MKNTTEGNQREAGSGEIRKLLPYAALSIFIHITLIALLMTIKMGGPKEKRVAFVELVDLPRAVRLQKPLPGVLKSGKTTRKRTRQRKPRTTLPARKKARVKPEDKEILKGKVPNLPVNPKLPPEKYFPPTAKEKPAAKEPKKLPEAKKEKGAEKNKSPTGETGLKAKQIEEKKEGGGGGETVIPDIKKITPSLGKMVIAATRKRAKGKGEGKGKNIGSENSPKKGGRFSEMAQGGTILTPLNSPSIQYISYFASIKRKIELVWQYPFDAIQRGIQGETIVDFSIGKDGKLVDVTLVESSGFKILDKEAIEAIRKASPFGPIPKQYKIDILKIRAHFIYEMHFLNLR